MQQSSPSRDLKSQTYPDYRRELARTSRVPTAAYVVGDSDQVSADSLIISMRGNDELYLYLDITQVTVTKFFVRIEFSDDQTTWYQEAGEEPATLAAGVIEVPVGVIERSFTTTGKYRLPIDVDDPFVRISVRATGAIDPGDLIGIDYMRRHRDSVVGLS